MAWQDAYPQKFHQDFRCVQPASSPFVQEFECGASLFPGGLVSQFVRNQPQIKTTRFFFCFLITAKINPSTSTTLPHWAGCLLGLIKVQRVWLLVLSDPTAFSQRGRKASARSITMKRRQIHKSFTVKAFDFTHELKLSIMSLWQYAKSTRDIPNWQQSSVINLHASGPPEYFDSFYTFVLCLSHVSSFNLWRWWCWLSLSSSMIVLI